MDEAFWSSVVKRWSDASENAIKLKKEIARLEEEKASHRCIGATSDSNGGHLSDLQAPNFSAEASVKAGGNRAIKSILRDELQDAEIGLGRAKEEYRKLQQDLAASSKTIIDLNLQNQKLVHDHCEELKRLREEYQSTLAVKRFRKFQSMSSIKSVSGPQKFPGGIFRSIPTPTTGPGHVYDLERQIETLQRSVEVSEADRQQTRHELIATREKLQKAEENIKVLLASIVKLQSIARHPVQDSLRHLSGNSVHAGSPRSSRISLSSHISQLQRLETNKPPKLSTLPPVALPRFTSLEYQEMTTNEHAPTPLSCLPLNRERALSKLPTAFDVPAVDASENMFDRPFLKHILGAGIQGLIEHFSGPSTPVDKKGITSSYLCPTVDHHPWCPSTPGQHGFIFVGFGKDKESYTSPVTRNLFVGLPKVQGRQRVFRYLGKYRVARAESLSDDEWSSLSGETKVMYADLTRNKGHDSRSVDDILLAYDSGEAHIPCLQLQCINFDQTFYNALLSYKNMSAN